jgi:hypothetical protein
MLLSSTEGRKDEGGGECNKVGERSTYTIMDIKLKEGDWSVISA